MASPSDTRDTATTDAQHDTQHVTRTSDLRDLTGRRTIAGLFRDREDAERAVHELKDAGFSGDQIGVVMRDRTAQGELAEQTGTHAAAGAVSGLVGGGLLGGLVGFLLAIGAIAIPGIGPVVAGGALAAALGVVGGTAAAGAGIGAAAGGLLGALIGMGIPETEARELEAGVRAGSTLVTVETRGRGDEALRILERHGASTGPETITRTTEATTTTTDARTTEAEPPHRERTAAMPPAAAAASDAPSNATERSPRPDVRPETTSQDVGDVGMDSHVAMEEARAADSAQRRAERGIDDSFVAPNGTRTDGAGTTNTAETGTSDTTYNLVSVIYHALQGVDTYEAYAADAERTGDRELARFFRDTQEENRRRATRAKELLRERLS